MEEVKRFLKTLDIKEDDNLILAISGGPDSMALLVLLEELREELKFNIVVAHVNHHLRKESEKEEKYIKEYCEQNNLKFEIYDYYPRDSKNFEAKARNARYEFFEKLIEEYNSKYLFTAHHADDLAETILMKIVRGSTLSGYSGIKLIDKRENYQLVRPLLLVSKKEIIKYLKEKKKKYFKDKSNKNKKYTRNRFRLKILPLLRLENPNLNNNFIEYSNYLDEVDQFIEEVALKKYKKIVKKDKIDLKLLNKENKAIKRRILEIFLEEEYGDDIVELNKRHLNQILKLSESYNSKKSIDLPFNKTLIREYASMFFYKENKYKEEKVKLVNNLLFNKFKIYLDKDGNLDNNFVMRFRKKDVEMPLYVRNFKRNDEIKLKNSGTKKVIEIFRENKISTEDRKYYPIIVDSNDEVIFIPGLKKSRILRKKTEKYDTIITCELKEEI